ncbi:phospholipase A2-like [Peromyscus leucopus]|uniref:phospholipase A2-like n=1 Tax=Peromyscus leucopus TaxID=10041 RepID=UPI0018851720|nr:phospholipase A2-like [Peromyscus leucopus]
MKLLLLVLCSQVLLHRASALRLCGSSAMCSIATFPGLVQSSEYRFYGCYCGLWGIGNSDEDLDSCCRTRDNCLAQVITWKTVDSS